MQIRHVTQESHVLPPVQAMEAKRQNCPPHLAKAALFILGMLRVTPSPVRRWLGARLSRGEGQYRRAAGTPGTGSRP